MFFFVLNYSVLVCLALQVDNISLREQFPQHASVWCKFVQPDRQEQTCIVAVRHSFCNERHFTVSCVVAGPVMSLNHVFFVAFYKITSIVFVWFENFKN